MEYTRVVRSGAVLLAGLLLTVGYTPPAHAQDPDTEFRSGVAAFEQGRFEEAEKHFANVLKSRPDHTQALRYRDEAGYRFWVQVLARGGRLGDVAKRILKAAEEGAVRARQDEEKLREVLEGLWSDDFMTQIETVEQIVAKWGHYVVPLVVDVLKDRHDDEKRVRVIQLLARLGEEGTLAVIELLEAKDDVVLLQNAAAILGHTGDVRAIPPLKRLEVSSQDALVKEAARKAILQIGDPGGDATDTYARAAEAFYEGNPLFLDNRYHEHVVWKWRNGRLTHRTVPRFRWNEELAEEYAYDGLTVDPEDQSLWMSLLNTYAQEVTEIEESLRVARMIGDRGGEVDGDAVAEMEELTAALQKARMLVASRGADGVLAALGKALADQRAQVAVFLIERLHELNLDDSMLTGGGAIEFLPEPERTAAPKREPARPAPQPAQPKRQPAEPKREPARPAREPAQPKPAEPKREPTQPQPRRPRRAPADDDPAPSLDDDAPTLDDEPKRPRRPRRPKRVSEGERPRSEVTRFAFRDGDGSNSATIQTGGAALSAALSYGDKRVRYAAAIALARLNPKASFSNSDQVMTNLIDALSESGQRVVLVVERDRHDRNRLVGLLRELGYMAFGVASGIEGLIRAKTFPGEDLVLVSTELNERTQDDLTDPLGDEPMAYQFIDELRDDYRTRPIKVMVVTPEERVSDAQSLVDEGKAVDVLSPNIDKASLAGKLEAAFGDAADQRDEKARSDAIAHRAAQALASLDVRHTQFDVAAAAAALAKNVRRDAGRPDSVRLACVDALAAIGVAAKPAALEVLVREFRDDTNSVEVRRALPRAIGECIKGGPVSDDLFGVLKEALADDDQGVWSAAGYALGKAKLTGAQALAVFEAQRLE